MVQQDKLQAAIEFPIKTHLIINEIWIGKKMTVGHFLSNSNSLIIIWLLDAYMSIYLQVIRSKNIRVTPKALSLAFNTILSGIARKEPPNKVLFTEVFNRMQQDLIEPTEHEPISYAMLFKVLGRSKELQTVDHYFNEVKTKRKMNKFCWCCAAFFKEKCELLYNTVIHAHGDVGDTDTMLRYFQQMKEESKPTLQTYVSVIRAFAKKVEADNVNKVRKAMICTNLL